MQSNRRRFLVTGLGAATLWGSLRDITPFGRVAAQGATAEERLAALGIELPPAPTPVATYVPTVRVDNTLYVSGTGPRLPEGGYITGKVGGEVSIAEANRAARVVGLNVLSAVRDALGSLDRIVRVVKVHGMVNAVPDFTEQPQVVNGFSDLMVEIFGAEAGKGARSAVGMGSLPFNIPVEIESTFLVRD